MTNYVYKKYLIPFFQVSIIVTLIAIIIWISLDKNEITVHNFCNSTLSYESRPDCELTCYDIIQQSIDQNFQKTCDSTQNSELSCQCPPDTFRAIDNTCVTQENCFERECTKNQTSCTLCVNTARQISGVQRNTIIHCATC